MIVVPKTSQRLWLTMILDFVRGADDGPGPLLFLHLYANDFAPDVDTVLADFVECSFPGYSAKAIGADFPFPNTNPDGNAESKSKTYVFTPTAQQPSEIVHGWYLTFQTALVPALLFSAERTVPGFATNQAGQDYRVQLTLTLGGCVGA